jgi:predicted molibdopterin-dependent oxidoreductase YjgC
VEIVLEKWIFLHFCVGERPKILLSERRTVTRNFFQAAFLVVQEVFLFLPSSGLLRGIGWFQNILRRVITQKMEEFASTSTEAYDHAKVILHEAHHIRASVAIRTHAHNHANLRTCHNFIQWRIVIKHFINTLHLHAF